MLIKVGLLALGAFLLYRYFTADDGGGVDVAPWDQNPTEDGGGGGGGSPGGGDYQAPTTEDPAGTSIRWAPGARKVDAGKLRAFAGLAVPVGRDAAAVKPGAPLTRGPRPTGPARTPPVARRPR